MARWFAVALWWMGVLSASISAAEVYAPQGPPPPRDWRPVVPQAFEPGPWPASLHHTPVATDPFEVATQMPDWPDARLWPSIRSDFGVAQVDLPRLLTDRVITTGQPAHAAATDARGEFWLAGVGLVQVPAAEDESRTWFELRFDGLRADANAMTWVSPSAKTINVDGTQGAALGGGRIEDAYRYESESIALLFRDLGPVGRRAHQGLFMEISLVDTDLTYDSLYTGSGVTSPTRPLHQVRLEQRSYGAMLGLELQQPLVAEWWLTGTIGAGIYATDADLRAFDPTSLASAQDDRNLMSWRGLARLGLERRDPRGFWSVGFFAEADYWDQVAAIHMPTVVGQSASIASDQRLDLRLGVQFTLRF